MSDTPPNSTHTAWDERNGKATLKTLNADYPGYSTNELYAIWCHVHQRIPLDQEGRVIIEQWQIHAAVDGQHVQSDGFKVSRALFGRARKARKGQRKPKRVARTVQKEESPTVMSPPQAGRREAFSQQAMEFAQHYDRALQLVPSLLAKRGEVARITEQVAEVPLSILMELAAHHEAVRECLTTVGRLPEHLIARSRAGGVATTSSESGLGHWDTEPDPEEER